MSRRADSHAPLNIMHDICTVFKIQTAKLHIVFKKEDLCVQASHPYLVQMTVHGRNKTDGKIARNSFSCSHNRSMEGIVLDTVESSHAILLPA